MATPTSGRSARSSRPLPSQRRAAVALGVVCLAMAGYLGLHHRDQVHLRTANDLAIEGRYEAAIVDARPVTRSPAAGEALLLRARAAQALGRHREAVRLFRRAAERDPRSWHLHRDWAISLLALNRRGAARDQIELANTLNPRMPTPPGF